LKIQYSDIPGDDGDVHVLPVFAGQLDDNEGYLSGEYVVEELYTYFCMW